MLSRATVLGDLLRDLVRLPWSLVVWNVRKCLFRLRGTQGRCPCQHPSDSGRAYETHCDAAAEWRRPERFRLVCPLLVRNRDGSVCSVDARDVRPFFGRAIGIFLAVGVGLGLGVATAGYLVVRSSGVREITWLDFAWPGRWNQIGRARSKAFCEKALIALQRGDLEAARLALATAAQLDPRNYTASMLLSMAGSMGGEGEGTAELAFEWLARRHPERVLESAIRLHDLLLSAGRFRELARFSAQMAIVDRPRGAVWARSLVSGLRMAGNAAEFEKKYAKDLARLDPALRALIEAERLIQENQPAAARMRLRRPVDDIGSQGYLAIQVEQLIRLRDLATATAVKNATQPPFNAFRNVAFQYWIEREAANATLADLCFTRLLDRELDASELDWLLAMLVRAPDAAHYARLHRLVMAAPPEGIGVAELGGGMWVAAVVCGDQEAVGYWAGYLRDRAHVVAPGAKRISFEGGPAPDAISVPRLLGALTLPRETIYGLLYRMQPARPEAASGRK